MHSFPPRDNRTPAGISLAGWQSPPRPEPQQPRSCFPCAVGDHHLLGARLSSASAAAAATGPPPLWPPSFQAHGVPVLIAQFPSICAASSSLELTNAQLQVTVLCYTQSCSAVPSKKQKEVVAVTSRFPYPSSH